MGDRLRLLKKAAHEVLLVLSLQYAAVDGGTRGGIPLPTPETLGCRDAPTAPQLADEGRWGTSAVHAVRSSKTCDPLRDNVLCCSNEACPSRLNLYVPCGEPLRLTSSTGGLVSQAAVTTQPMIDLVLVKLFRLTSLCLYINVCCQNCGAGRQILRLAMATENCVGKTLPSLYIGQERFFQLHWSIKVPLLSSLHSLKRKV